ncbi:hypothetical protein LPJ81_001579 [Coemansia sp. IMI 209127]|nr:hypothetical protein LPJ81_001579 [Coemansia sp. IMI 209127]
MPPIRTVIFKLESEYVIVRHPSVDGDEGAAMVHRCCHRKKHRHHHHHHHHEHHAYRGFNMPKRHLIQRPDVNMADLAVTELACIVLSIALALLFLFIGSKIRGLASKDKGEDRGVDSTELSFPNDADDGSEPNTLLLQKF